MGIAPRCRRHLRPPQRQEEEEEKDPFHLSLSLLEDDSAPGEPFGTHSCTPKVCNELLFSIPPLRQWQLHLGRWRRRSGLGLGRSPERSLAVEWFFVSPAFIAFVQGCLGTWNAVLRRPPVRRPSVR